MEVRIREIRLYQRQVRFRLPFRYGIVTLTEAPQAFLRVRIESAEGRQAWGCGAEMLSPKWFDKNPELSNEENFEQLRRSIRLAAKAYLSESGLHTPFQHFEAHYRGLLEISARQGLNGLVAGFGPSMIDRAVLDGVLRLRGLSFWDGMKANVAGFRPAGLTGDLTTLDEDHFLSSLTPRFSLHARHTVGLVDPITATDLVPSQRIDDGLPETLEEVVKVYRPSYFKVKVNGRLEEDLTRLLAVAGVLDRLRDSYFVSLDGNEQFQEAAEVGELWERMNEWPQLRRFVKSVLFVEQPITRTHALKEDVSQLSARRPVIIDESDENLDCFPLARSRGYRGVSSKICKGLYKSLINRARCQVWNEQAGEERYFMTGEDLSIQAGVALQQDLALVSFLGLTHLERNGHHYVHGFSGVPDSEQAAFLEQHPDLYLRKRGTVCVRLEDGSLRLDSLKIPGFAHQVEPDWNSLEPVAL